jgi:hypothetical protein
MLSVTDSMAKFLPLGNKEAIASLVKSGNTIAACFVFFQNRVNLPHGFIPSENPLF